MALKKKSLIGAAATKTKDADRTQRTNAEAKAPEPGKPVSSRKLALAKVATAKLSTARLTTLRKLS